MDDLIRLWRRNTFVRILAIGLIVIVFFLAVRNPFQVEKGQSWKVQLFKELIMFGGLLVFLIAFFLWGFAKFVLPVRGERERIEALIRLGLFPMGGHGQAIWIKDGSVEDSARNAGEWRYPSKLGRGVVILDGASGAQLKTSNRFTQTIGPGLTFTHSRESLAGMVFLGRRVSFPPVRPSANEDPFAPQGKGESNQEYQARIDRRKGVSGFTRDGVEALATMLVGFQLDINCSDGFPPKRFYFDPEAVQRAVNAGALESSAQNYFSEESHIPWDNFPGYFVVELWREYLRKFALDELFTEFPEGRDFAGMTALEVIRERVRVRLTQPYDVVLDAYGNVIQQRAPSREYHLLKEWGIKVLFSPVRNPCFSPDIEQTLVKKWFSFWKWRADDERKFIERKRTYMRRKGHFQAKSTFANILVRVALPNIHNIPNPPSYVDDKNKENIYYIRETLLALLDATRRLCISDTEFSRVIGNEEVEIMKIIDWLNWLKSDVV